MYSAATSDDVIVVIALLIAFLSYTQLIYSLLRINLATDEPCHKYEPPNPL